MSISVLDAPAAPPAPAADARSAAEGEGSSDPSPSRPRLATFAGWVIKGLFGLVLLALVVVSVGPKVYPFETFYVRTGSMVPSIPVGALVVATRVPASELAQGDVIVFERPGSTGTMVVHRIVAVEDTESGRAFVTKGDANDGADAWRVPATGSGWRSVTAIPRAGFAVGWLHTALSRRGWLGAVAVFVAAYALTSIWKSEKP